MSTEYLSDLGLKSLGYVQTGDILLFKSSGDRTSTIINLGIRSLWTHVGIAIWEGGDLKVFESSLSGPEFDELTGTYRKGTRKTSILNIVGKYATILARPVNIARDSLFYTRFNQFLSDYTGKAYTSLLKIPFIPFICLEDTGIHCSELVGRFFDHVGMLEDKPGLKNKCSFNILPSDFAPGTQDPEIDRLFTDKPSITLYTSSSMESPSLLFLCFVTLIVTSLNILLYVI